MIIMISKIFCLLASLFPLLITTNAIHLNKDQIVMEQLNSINYHEQSIKEWHFHVYFICTNAQQVESANSLRVNLINAVHSKQFVAILPGINQTHVPNVDTKRIPHFNTRPIGPHISGSYEVWVPREYFAKVLSWMTLNRGRLSVLIHPLTVNELEDHTGRSMWLGDVYPLDLTKLSEKLDHIPLQYPELHLGYSSN